LLAGAAVGLVLHSLVWNFVTDDAFISFVYSRNLADHGQLVFNLGERVEGYTNFSWTLLLAALYKVGLAPEQMSRLLATLAAIGTLCVSLVAAAQLRLRDAGSTADGAPPPSTAEPPWHRPSSLSPWDALPALLLASLSGFACWTSGGLETQLFALLVTLGFALHLDEERRSRVGIGAALCFALSALTRPEGLLFFALVWAHRGVTRLLRRRGPLGWGDARALGLFVALVGPHLLWRRAYYGYWVPNTFYIKASGGLAAFSQGGYYLLRVVEQFHLWALVPLLVGALLRGGLRRPGLRALLGLWLPVGAIFALYVASVGGDFMGLFRFVMPVVPLTALVAGATLRLLLERTRPLVAVAASTLLLAGHVAHTVAVDRASLIIGADRGIDSPGFLRWYTADRAAIGRWFGARARPDDLAAVGGAGAQVWYSGMRSLDCFGLSDAYIAHEVRPVSVRPGHQKYAPLAYQLQQRPTIITSNYYRIQGAPYVPSTAEREEWRARGYRYVSARVPGLSSPWYAFLLRSDRTLPDIVDDAQPARPEPTATSGSAADSNRPLVAPGRDEP
jgi:hypothetical protein